MSKHKQIIVKVLELVDQGIAYGEIARRFDLASRSAVAGIVYRARHPEPRKSRPGPQYGKIIHIGVNPRIFAELKQTAVEWDCTISELCRVLLTCALEDQNEDDG